MEIIKKMKLFEHSKYLIIFDIVKYWFSKWWNLKKLLIFQIVEI